MFPPEPEKPWWHHLAWALPGMMMAAGLGWWLGSRGEPEVVVQEKIVRVEVPVTQPAPPVQLTNQPAPPIGNQVTNVPPSTNQFRVSRGILVETNRAAAARIGLIDPNEAVRVAPGHDAANFVTRPPKTDFEVQVALDRLGYSPGSIDGIAGGQTRSALVAFQHRHGLRVTGTVDAATRAKLSLNAPAIMQRTVTTNELATLQPLGATWTEKSKQTAMAHESILEMFAEQHHCSPRYLMKLNPTVAWNSIAPGTPVKVPHTTAPLPPVEAALVHIQLSSRTLDVYDGSTNLVARFPCSIGTLASSRPVGSLEVTTVAEAANYTFDPARFPTSPEARVGTGKLTLQPGPNNPVGTTWIGLNRDGYGIHGTPDPEKIGRTTSLGCFRLSNWNVQKLVKMVRPGTPVRVDP